MKIGITIGDQAGIGPEIIDKSMFMACDICDPVVIGDIVSNPIYGKVNPLYGNIAGRAIKEAVIQAMNGTIDAIVTAPIHKEALKLGGWDFPGHTEMLAALTNIKDYAMMLVCGNLRVVHVTTHVPLRLAVDLITQQRVLKTILLANNACKSLGIKKPRIAVAALNPHASDNGLFGNEEELEIIPAIYQAQDQGVIVAERPTPADVVFAQCLGMKYDCVVAMYHDQGHIPVKTVGFKFHDGEWEKMDGVNVTLGLPLIRTSPDHGVAFGKAGKGIADPTSMFSAIKLAVKLVKNRSVK